MLQPNEIYLNGNNSTVQIASAHETSKTFSYNGNEVLFDIKDDVMVNATQLAKIYGKRPNDYLSLPATISQNKSPEAEVTEPPTGNNINFISQRYGKF